MAPSVEGYAAYLRKPVSEIRSLLESPFAEIRESVQTQMRNYSEQIQHYFPEEGLRARIGREYAENLPPSIVTSIDQVSTESKEMVQKIFEDYAHLHALVVSNERLIQKRWMKMTRTRRREILLAAWPDISSVHRPDLAAFRQSDWILTPELSALPAAAWPYINLEDLMHPKSLLIFLNARARYPPHYFAYSDLELAPMWKLGEQLLNCRKDRYTMAFVGRNSIHTYGELVKWETDTQVALSIRNGLTVHVDHGTQILHIQSTILSGLLDCALEILRDILQKELELVPQPEPPQLSGNDGSYDTLDVITREASYKLPVKLDYSLLCSLVVARKNDAIDHIWALREDPSYFADMAQDYREHRAELVLNATGKPHPGSSDEKLYCRSLKLMTNDAYINAFAWDEILQRITKLDQLSTKYADLIHVGEDLPGDYFELLVETRFFLEALSLDFVGIINMGCIASPPLRKYFIRIQNKLYRRSDMGTFEDDYIRDRVIYTFQCLADKELRDSITLHSLMDELEHLRQETPKGKTYISSWVSRYISQLSVITQCLHLLHLYQPWAKQIEGTVKERQNELLEVYTKIFSVWVPTHCSYFYGTGLAGLGNPKDGKFVYPIHKRRNQENVKSLRMAENALDKFWSYADAHWKTKSGKTPHEMIAHILGERLLQRTPPWVEPSQPRKDTTNQARLDITLSPFSESYCSVDGSVARNLKRVSLVGKTKIKTRGTPTNTESVQPELIRSGEEKTEDLQPIFTVDRRGYKVFRTLFHSANSPDQPGEIAWNDFLYAMSLIGFKIMKLQGSSWHFAPTKLDVEQPIQFHEPHPSSKLPFIWARRYGRRLARSYGWDGNMFRLA